MTDPHGRLAPTVRLAPAKLNLSLAVVGRRPDGYHELHSVMAPLELADVLTVAPLPGGDDVLHVTGFDPGPAAENLVLRAIAATRSVLRAARVAPPPLAARLEKRIPVGAGLAGGSSDAAAAIDAALEAWGAELDPDRRLEIAAGLGSDLPFFLAGGTALVEGRGERVTPLVGVRAAATGPREGEPPGGVGVLLVTPPVRLSTAAVFAAFDAGIVPADPGSTHRTSDHLAAELRGGLRPVDLVARGGVLAVANDLLPAAVALVPGLAAFRRAVGRVLARPVGLSGSGPTLWALYPSRGDAVEAAASVRDSIATGAIPVPGDAAPFIEATTIRPGEQHRSEGGEHP